MKMKFWFMVGLMLFTCLRFRGLYLPGVGTGPQEKVRASSVTVEGQDPEPGSRRAT